MNYAIVTGATFGIGKEISKVLSNDYHVIACGRRTDLIPEHSNITPVYLDITNSDSINMLLSILSNKKIDVVVNCAGGSISEFQNTILDSTVDYINNDFMLNTSATFNIIKNIIPYMDGSTNPIIINITSVAGHHIFRASPSYTIAKHSQSVLTDILRRDLSPLGIRVSEIIPSSVNSHKNSEMDGRSIDPSDVADLVKYICGTKKYVDINYISIGHVKEIPFCS